MNVCKMSEYTFVDNKEISVAEKIRRYFLLHEPPSESLMNQSADDSSSSIIDIDDSILEKSKRFDILKKKQDTLKNVLTQSNLCADGSDAKTNSTKTDDVKANADLRTKLLQSYNKKLWDKSMIIDSSTNSSISTDDDESFLEHERLCNLPSLPNTPKNLKNSPIVCTSHFNVKHLVDETNLADIEAPSHFWDQSLNTTDSILHKMSPAKSRPSTIYEELESEQTNESLKMKNNFSSNTENSKNTNSVSIKNANKSEFVPTIKYRESFFNMFPKKIKAKKIFEYDETSPIKQLANPVNLLIDRKDLVFTGPQISHTKYNIAENADSSICDGSESLNCSDTNLGSKRNNQFNDTIEAMDFYMSQGRKMLNKGSSSVAENNIKVLGEGTNLVNDNPRRTYTIKNLKLN